jgi:peptide/nickel transport system ATP-binding protein
VSVLDVRNLTVEFGQRGGGKLLAVDNLSFGLREGQTLALVGESGSGKSTVVRALAQLVKRTSGEILLDGVPAGRHGRALRGYRHRVQLVFQDPFASLNPMHTIRHHLIRPLQLRLDPPRGEALEQAVHELLRSVNLNPPDEVAGKHPHELSGGQRQRVAIARALATNPDVLLADEPVSMLDVSIRLEVLNLLDRLKQDRNLAMLYVTHDLATARHFSSEIMVMYRGEIVERGPSD